MNYVQSSDKAKEWANVYATLDPSKQNQQYSILEVQGNYEGKPLTFLIDLGNSYSFISPIIAKHRKIEAKPIGKKLLRGCAGIIF